MISSSIEPRRTAAPPPAEPPAGAVLRVDQPHAPAEAVSVTVAEPTVREPIVDAASSEPQGSRHEHLLVQATQIAEHLREQCAELDRREQRLNSQLAQLDQEQRNVRLWVTHFETQVHEREDELVRCESEFSQRMSACLKLEQELQGLHEDLLRQQQELHEQRAKFAQEREAALGEIATARSHLDKWLDEARHELEIERAECDSELATERNRHRYQLDQDRRDLAADRQRLTDELHQERIRLDNRQQFQEEHLQRLRQELEAAQTEFRFEQECRQAELAERAAQTDRRSEQLNRARELLDARVESLECETEQFAKSRRAFQDLIEGERHALAGERQRWEDDRASQQADLRRQQDLLAVHAENLETRRVRFDRMRAELEDTNRKALEMRLAVEEAHARLCERAGAEAARQQVEEARQVLSEYYRHTRDSLISLRHELLDQESRLKQQADDLHEERRGLAEWVQQQESRLQADRAELTSAGLDLEARERGWLAAADRWAAERSEAEAVIRDLLKRLE